MSVLSTQLVVGLNSADDINTAIATHAQDLVMTQINRMALLAAFASVESSFGMEDQPRYEPAFGLDGMYFRKSKDLQFDYYSKYGPLVAMSYGPWQIMYPTAKSVGFLGHPLDLWPAYNSCPYVVEFLNQLFKRGATTVEKLAQGYNSGSINRDASPIVKKYIGKLIQNYQRFDLSYNH
jgi:hypothetical protein